MEYALRVIYYITLQRILILMHYPQVASCPNPQDVNGSRITDLRPEIRTLDPLNTKQVS